ncbi:hypothetical protein HDU76_004612 [Blyttiomyces sp. JEL0837]|nr:hypothetical protein HDU76_004612 [Blyttiomyces sp. JEL0837]
MEVDVVDDLKKLRGKQIQGVLGQSAGAVKDVGEAGKLAYGEVADTVAGSHHHANVDIIIDQKPSSSTRRPAQAMSPSPAVVPIALTQPGHSGDSESSPSHESNDQLRSGHQASANGVGGVAAGVTSSDTIKSQTHTIPATHQQLIHGNLAQHVAPTITSGTAIDKTNSVPQTGSTGSILLDKISTIAIAITLGSIAITTVTTTIPGGVSPLGILPPTPENIKSHFPGNQFTNSDSNAGCLCSTACLDAMQDVTDYESSFDWPFVTDAQTACSKSQYFKDCYPQALESRQNGDFGYVHNSFVTGRVRNVNTTDGNSCDSTAQNSCYITVLAREASCVGYTKGAQLTMACCASM